MSTERGGAAEQGARQEQRRTARHGLRGGSRRGLRASRLRRVAVALVACGAWGVCGIAAGCGGDTVDKPPRSVVPIDTSSPGAGPKPEPTSVPEGAPSQVPSPESSKTRAQ
jgi:hypothetical protein